MRQNPAQYSFSSGEVSPLLYGRRDYQRTQTGLRTCRGFVPLRQGPVTRGPGSWYKADTRNTTFGRLINFEFAADDSVVLELTALAMRVWRYGALVMDGGDPYELAIPYSYAAIARLQFVQSADVMYLADGVLPVQRLARLALDDWTIGDASFTLGPFRVENDDAGVTISASAATGTVTLSGVGDPFVAGHVGGLFQLRAIDDEDVPTWVGNSGVDPNEVVRYDGRYYQNVNASADDTSVNPPVHTEGTVKSGRGDKASWLYLSDMIGVVRITAVADANSATATVLKRLPPPLVGNPTHRWSEGAWSPKNGYPAALAIDDQRLYAAATPAEPRTLWGSTQGAMLDFEPGTAADASFAYTISGGDSTNRIIWLRPGNRVLFVGALGEIHAAKSTATLESLGPQTASFRPAANIGASAALPVVPAGTPLFIPRGGNTLVELRYDLSQEAWLPVELSLPADHLGAAGFSEIAWMEAPLQMGWIRRGNGELALLVRDPAEDVLGWAEHSLAGGFVESVVVTASETGARDHLVMIVHREIGGEVRHFVESLASIDGVLGAGQPVSYANHLFAARLKTSASPFTIVDELGHLEGETVHAWTDKGELGPFTVEDARVDLGVEVMRAVVGKFDDSHVLATLDLPAEVREGAGLGRMRRVKTMGARFHRTAAAEVRHVERSFGQPDVTSPWTDATRLPAPVDLVEGWSGTVSLNEPSGWCEEVSYEFRPRGGAPMTLMALSPAMEAAGG